MNYENYGPEDFLEDDDFLKWICAPNPESDAFWDNFLLKHPEKSESIAKARNTVEKYGKLSVYKEQQKYKRSTSEAVYSAIVQGVENTETPVRTVPFFRLWGVAASVILLLSAGWYFYYNQRDLSSTEGSVEAGSSKAILTLSDGSEVLLQQGTEYVSELAKSDGNSVIYQPVVESDKKIDYNELTIPRGGEFFLLLSDSTKVWLNSETKIRYPESFVAGASREVELLYGEAYFEVSPSEKHRGSNFVVQTKNQEIEVLGTQFNIRVFPDEKQIVSTLVEGEVVLNTPVSQLVLKPNDQAVYDFQNSKVKINEIDVYDEISWKRGLFSFSDEPLESIAKTLSRWYDVPILISNRELDDVKLSGAFSRKLALEEILDILSQSINISYSVNKQHEIELK